MKVSIITITYNSAATLRDTIESVLQQSYPSIEYIIKDGGSTDDTLAIARSYGDKIKLIFQPDKGIYDAMNQGLAAATGDVIGLLNSDDFYADNTVIQEVVNKFKTTSADSLYGDLQYVDANDTSKITRYWQAGEYNRLNFLKGWMPPHPTFFVKREIYKKFGFFKPEFKSAGDYEMMLRLLYKHQISAAYLPKVLIKMRAGGVSNVSFKNRLRANQEDRQAWKINDIQPKWFTLYAKPLSKVLQWVKR